MSVIGVDFDIVDQLLIIYSAFILCWERMGVQWDITSSISRHQERSLYDILVKFVICMKLIRVIETGSN
jgi:hypothetical protein